MKKQIMTNIAILGLFIMLAIANVNAQTPSGIEIKIPFDFSAGKATLKAGVYSFKRTSGNTIAVRSADGKTTAIVIAPLTLGSRDSKAGERLVFNQYGDQFFLSQVWLSVETGRQLFTSSAESKVAREYKLQTNNAPPRRVEIALRTR